MAPFFCRAKSIFPPPRIFRSRKMQALRSSSEVKDQYPSRERSARFLFPTPPRVCTSSIEESSLSSIVIVLPLAMSCHLRAPRTPFPTITFIGGRGKTEGFCFTPRLKDGPQVRPPSFPAQGRWFRSVPLHHINPFFPVRRDPPLSNGCRVPLRGAKHPPAHQFLLDHKPPISTQ